MNNHWFVIINPTSGNRKYKKLIPKLLASLESNQILFYHEFTTYQKHEFELVKKAISNGYRKIISVGGDGTLHGIVNGIMSQTLVNSNEIKVAVFPTGTGNDWVNTYGITKNLIQNIKILKQEKTILQDIGKINLENDKSTIYFNNLAGIGFDGHVVKYINKYKKLGSISYLIGAFVGFFTYKPIDLNIMLNQTEINTKSLMVLIGLCNYSGGGMQLTKKPNSTDGLLDITIVEHINILTLLVNIIKLYNGEIINHKKVTTYKTNKITVKITDNNTPYIQADGELIKSSNFKIQLIPKAIQFVIP
ncbi:MAG: diacylglycerol kinase [Lutibacter sp.]|nr:MAG: diacylglycerol kinase [Lutibacter sp.]